MASGRCRGAGRLGWFLLGAIAGVGAVVVIALRAGRETEAGATAAGRGAEWLDRGRELLEDQAGRLREAFEAGREAMREEMRRWSNPPARDA